MCFSQSLLTVRVSLQAIIRGVCSIIDAFHFSVSSLIPALPDSASLAESEEAAQQLADEVEGAEGEEEAAAGHTDLEAAAHADIQSALTRRVLPTLRGQLVQDGEVSFHANCDAPH